MNSNIVDTNEKKERKENNIQMRNLVPSANECASGVNDCCVRSI